MEGVLIEEGSSKPLEFATSLVIGFRRDLFFMCALVIDCDGTRKEEKLSLFSLSE